MEKNSCTPINPKKLFMLWPKRKFLRFENSPPPPAPPRHNFCNGPSLMWRCSLLKSKHQLCLTGSRFHLCFVGLWKRNTANDGKETLKVIRCRYVCYHFLLKESSLMFFYCHLNASNFFQWIFHEVLFFDKITIQFLHWHKHSLKRSQHPSPQGLKKSYNFL